MVALLRAGFEVHFIGTNQEKAISLLQELPPEEEKRAKFVQLDLSNLKAVQDFALSFQKAHTHLDILANIAGVVLPKREISPEGFEKTFAIGYLSPFVLSNTLLPLLIKAGSARIVNVAGNSKPIFDLRLNFDNLDFKKDYGLFKAPFAAIHAKTVLTQSLAKRLENKGVAVNSFHPGLIRSDLTRNFIWPMRVLSWFASPFMKKSSTLGTKACLDPALASVSGQFLEGGNQIKIDFEEAYCDGLWEATINMLQSAKIELSQESY